MMNDCNDQKKYEYEVILDSDECSLSVHVGDDRDKAIEIADTLFPLIRDRMINIEGCKELFYTSIRVEKTDIDKLDHETMFGAKDLNWLDRLNECVSVIYSKFTK